MKNIRTNRAPRHKAMLVFLKRIEVASGSISLSLVLTALVSLLLTACVDHVNPPTSAPGQGIRPTGPKPDYAPDMDDQMLAILEELYLLSPVPLNLLPPQEARMKPTVKDAVNSLLAKNGITPPPVNVSISKQSIPGDGGAPISIAVYTPKGVSGTMPVIVYYHGGGWVIANSDVYEASTIALAQNTGAVVVSVNYRLAPENKFPIAHLDSYAAYKWVINNMSALNGNGKVAVAGESAGGNMAVTVAIMARDNNLSNKPLHILSVYPVANNDLNTPSYKKYAKAMPLNKPLVEYFTANYFNTSEDGNSPLISLVDRANLSDLPPTTIIGAEIDPLQSDGMDLRDALTNAHVSVKYQLYQGVTHEFFGTYAIEPKAAEAQALAATQLMNAFK